VLIPDDSEDDVMLLLRTLRSHGFEPVHQRVEDREGMRAALDEAPWDVVLSDYAMPGFTGLDALRLLQERELDLPFIIVSDVLGEDAAVSVMKAGAHDYLMKGQLTRLGEAIEREMAQAELRAERRQAIAKLDHLNRSLRALRGVNRMVMKEKDAASLLERAASLLVETRGYKSALFALTDEDRQPVHVVERLTDPVSDAVIRPAGTADVIRCIERAWEASGPIVIVCDPGGCEGCAGNAERLGRIRLARRMEYGGRSWGVAIIALPASVEPDDEELALFDELVGDVAFGLHGLHVAAQERETQHRLQQVYANMIQGVVYHSADGAIIDCNVAAERILGLSRDQILGRVSSDPGWRALKESGEDYRADDHPAMITLRTGQPAHGVMGVRNSALGSVRWIRIHASPEYAAGRGTPPCVLATFEDITAQREAAAVLRASEAQHRALFEGAPVGIFKTRSSGEVLSVNPAMARILGFDDPARCIGHYRDLGQELYVSASRREEFVAALLAEGSVDDFEYEAHTRDGRRIWLTMSARIAERFADGTFTIEGFTRDITRRKQAEHQFQVFMEHTPWIAFMRAHDGTFLWANRRLTEFLGDPVGRADDFLPLDADSDELRKEMRAQDRRVVEEGATVTALEMCLPLRAGARYMDVFKFPVPVESGERVLGAVCVDVTERVTRQRQVREMERQVYQSRRMETVGRLAGGVAHDFNNLLTVINSYAAFVAEGLEPDDPLREDVDQIAAAGARATVLTRQLLAFSRRQVLEPRVVNLNEVLSDLAHLLQRLLGEDVELRMALAEELGVVSADPAQLDQVVMHLAVNAREAMPRGGVLEIATSNVMHGFAPAAAPRPAVLISVSDTGRGISPDVLDQVFEPFFTTQPRHQAAGLGLATVYGVVKQSGGDITVESEVDKGTCFSVFLPCVEEVDPGASLIPVPRSKTGASETLLVVEDEPGVRELTRRILDSAGYEVLTAANGAEGLAVFELQGARIDLVVTDVVMPQMGGREMVDRLHEARPGLPAIYMSGYTGDAILHHGVLAEGTHFIAKPFATAALLDKVRSVLGRRD